MHHTTTTCASQPIFDNVTFLIDDGARLLRRGQSEAAIMVFNHALRESKRLLKHSESLSHNLGAVPILPPNDTYSSRPIEGYSMLQQSKKTGAPIAPACWEADYVYEVPFRVYCPISPPPLSPHAVMPFVLTCMYNLALAHHARAVQLRTDVSQFRTALQLYELAYSVLAAQKRTLAVSSIMMLALLNNLGRIHSVLGNDHRSRRCLTHLLSLLVFVREKGGQHLEAFFGSAADVVLSGPATAQAA